jgi:putative ABC transport system permease protein
VTRVVVRGLLARKTRLGLVAVAVMLGVAFVSGTFVLTDTLERSLSVLFAQSTEGVDVTVRAEVPFDGSPRELVPESLLATVGAVDGVQAAQGHVEGYAQVVGGGRPSGGAQAADRGRGPRQPRPVMVRRRRPHAAHPAGGTGPGGERRGSH